MVHVYNDGSRNQYGASATYGIMLRSLKLYNTATAPEDIVVDNDPGECGAVVNFPAPSVSDYCSDDNVTITFSPASGSLFSVGVTTVVVTATDGSGNSSSETFTVTVNDIEAPIMVVNDPIVLTLSEEGTASITVDDVDNGSYDGCAIESLN